MGTAIKHPVPDRVKPSFVIFDIRALWRWETHVIQEISDEDETCVEQFSGKTTNILQSTADRH